MTKRNGVNEEEIAAQQRRANITVVIAIILIVVLAVVAWLWWRGENEPQAPRPPETPAVVDARDQVTPEPEPEPDPREEEFPTPEPEPLEVIASEEEVDEPEPEPVVELPPLNESTPVLMSDLETSDVNTRPMRSEHVIRDLTLFVQNLGEGEVIRESAVVAPPDARFRTQRIDDQLYIDERSYERYNEIVDWFVNLDTQVLIRTFEQYQPLFEEAFSEISRPGLSFEEQLQEAIDVLLATPEPEGLLALSDERVMYTFADPELEQLPAAQKQMLRLGPENRQRVKAKLRDIRSALQNGTN